jgi:hypothetical protein
MWEIVAGSEVHRLFHGFPVRYVRFFSIPLEIAER